MRTITVYLRGVIEKKIAQNVRYRYLHSAENPNAIQRTVFSFIMYNVWDAFTSDVIVHCTFRVRLIYIDESH